MTSKKVSREDLMNKIMEHAGEGFENVTIVDRAQWIEDEHNRDWYKAFEAIDKHGDKIKLLNLLRSKSPLDSNMRFFLADLLQRYELKRPRGRQSVPAYDRSDKEAILHIIKDNIRRRPKEMSLDKAIEREAQNFDLGVELVSNHYHGRRGSSLRLKKRLSLVFRSNSSTKKRHRP